MLPLSCCYLLTSLQYKSSLSAPMATWNRHYRSENCFQLFGLDICCLDPTLLQAVPSIQSHHSRLRPEYCIYGHSGASFSPYGHLERPFQVRKLVPAGRPGCVLSRSSLVPSCATHSGSPRLPMARTLHLWPFLALFGHKMGQNGWNKKDMLWISIQVDPNDNLKALVLAKQKLEKR